MKLIIKQLTNQPPNSLTPCNRTLLENVSHSGSQEIPPFYGTPVLSQMLHAVTTSKILN
jgi:hypothetical protein